LQVITDTVGEFGGSAERLWPRCRHFDRIPFRSGYRTRRRPCRSLKPTPIGPILELTSYFARAAFPDGNSYLCVRDALGTFYDDQRFAGLFSDRGRPAETPWRLALVTVLQFAEGLPDRQAADTVRSRIDWKYAVGLELTDPGFDFSVLLTPA
jgi:hypothetical protein